MAGRLHSRMSQLSISQERSLDVTVLQMATDIHRTASVLAPKLTRALVKSGRIERIRPAYYRVLFGNRQVPYARRRHFENKKNPQTLRYLERAGDATARRASVYLSRRSGASR